MKNVGSYFKMEFLRTTRLQRIALCAALLICGSKAMEWKDIQGLDPVMEQRCNVRGIWGEGGNIKTRYADEIEKINLDVMVEKRSPPGSPKMLFVPSNSMDEKRSPPGSPERRSEQKETVLEPATPVEIWARIVIQGKRSDPSFQCQFSLRDNTGSAQTSLQILSRQTEKSNEPLPGVDLTTKKAFAKTYETLETGYGKVIAYEYDSYCNTDYSGKFHLYNYANRGDLLFQRYSDPPQSDSGICCCSSSNPILVEGKPIGDAFKSSKGTIYILGIKKTFEPHSEYLDKRYYDEEEKRYSEREQITQLVLYEYLEAPPQIRGSSSCCKSDRISHWQIVETWTLDDNIASLNPGKRLTLDGERTSLRTKKELQQDENSGGPLILDGVNLELGLESTSSTDERLERISLE